MGDDLRADALLATVPEVDGYKVLEPCVLYAKVGQGGMGAVYRGRHVNLGVDVAVKVLDPLRAQQDAQSLARFRREAQLAASIRHENLVRVYDVREASGLHYIVMEYVTGETAAERVARKGRLAPREAVAIGLGAARGLAAAHALGIVHRDVTPDNILISREGVVKVADLGLAKPTWSPAELTATRMMMGTPRYMPPEQWEDSRSVGPPGDVWALGATLYFLLAGDHAIGFATLPEVIGQICAQPFPDILGRADVPEGLAIVIERCTRREAADRFPDAAALGGALEAIAAGDRAALEDAAAGAETPRLASVSPPPERTLMHAKAAAAAGKLHRPARRSRPRAVLLSITILLAAAVLIFLAGRPGREAGRGAGALDVDPRTLAYRLTPDNVLTDPSREPRPPADAPRGGTVNVPLFRGPLVLNDLAPGYPGTADAVTRYVREPLAVRSRIDPERFVPGIANRVVVSDDTRAFIVDVRKGTFWHPPCLTPEERDGDLAWLAALPPQEITADDVKFTFDVAKDPNRGRWAGYFAGIDSVDVLDRYTVAVRWREKGYYNLAQTLSVAIHPRFILGRDRHGRDLAAREAVALLTRHWFNSRICGSGPFRFVGVEGSAIRLSRSDAYWGTQPALDAIVAHPVENSDDALSMFKVGELDLLVASTAQYRSEFLEGGEGSLRRFVEQGEVEVHRQEQGAYHYIGWNLRHPILRDRAVRRALACAFPKARVIREVYAGLALPHDSPVHRYARAYVPDLVEPFSFDLARAAALLDEAGWVLEGGIRKKTVDGEPTELRFTLEVPAGGAAEPARMYKGELAHIGVTLEVESTEFGELARRLKENRFEAYMLGWYGAQDWSPREIWHSHGSANYVGFASDRVDAIIARLESELNAGERKRLWLEFQKEVVAEQPCLFTVIPQAAVFVRSRLRAPFVSPEEIWLLPCFIR